MSKDGVDAFSEKITKALVWQEHELDLTCAEIVGTFVVFALNAWMLAYDERHAEDAAPEEE